MELTTVWKWLRAQVRNCEPADRVVISIWHFFDLLISPVVLVTIFEPIFWLRGMRSKDSFKNEDIKKILVLKTDRIGDITLTTPFLRELRKAFPNSRISFLLDSSVSPLVELCPHIDEIVRFDQNGWSRYWRWHCFLFALPASLKLWSHRFDLAIRMGWSTDRDYSSAITYLSGARWRLGYTEHMQAEKEEINRGYDRFFTHLIKASCNKHEVQHNLHVLEELGWQPQSDKIELWLSNADEEYAQNLISSFTGTDDSRPLIAFCVGASVERKKWPIERFKEVAQWLVREHKARILVVGGKNEYALADQLVEAIPGDAINIAGKTSIRQCAAVLKHCDLYVGNDTGPMHLAAVFGVAVLAIYTYPATAEKYQNNCPHRFGPWQVPSQTLQPKQALEPCNQNVFGACIGKQQHCILQISVDEAKEALAGLMERQKQVRSR